MRRVARLLMLLGVAVGAGTAIDTGPAGAVAPEAQAWWWFAQVGGVPAPPWVPGDGLYVASNPSGTEALSALRFALPTGGSARTIRLQVAGETRGTPVVGLCMATSSWQATQGGRMAEAPAYSCEAGVAPGTVASDGKSVTFSVFALARGETLDVALVPLKDPSGANPTFQLALAKPDGAALEVSSPAPDEPVIAEEGAASSESFTTGTTTGSSFSEGFSAVAADPLPPPAQPEPTEDAVVGTLPQTPLSAANRAASDDDNDLLRPLGFLLIAASAYAYHRLSTVPDRTPRSLVAVGQPAAEVEGSQG